jgi:3-deoxy-7-phosphoheptulonate synthase
MILHVQKKANLAALQDFYRAYAIEEKDYYVLITPSSLKEVDESHQADIIASFPMDSDIQLASRKYIPSTREIKFSDTLTIGGATNHTMMITGPCSVESEEQIDQVAKFCVEQGVKVLRAGCYKPRTSPYTFQGLGHKGLILLAKMRDKYGLKIITEVKDATHVDDVIEFADIIQIGAKAMYDHGILRACSKIQKPIVLKRGFGSTLQEFVQSAEFILSGGNMNVALCERGIRTYETKTRFTLDLCGVAYLKEHTNLPIILDPSHAMGYAYGVADLTRACVAMGIDGLLIETHPDPSVAKSDASQQLNFEKFSVLKNSLDKVAESVGRKMI